MDGVVNPPGNGMMLLKCLLEPIQPAPQPSGQSPLLAFGSSVVAAAPRPVTIKPSIEGRPWVCKQCGFRFKYKNNLAEHMRFYHMKGSVPCNKCSLVFPTSKHLRQHRKNHAVEQGRCPHCRYLLSGAGHNSTLYNEMYRQHLPQCRRRPAKASSQTKKSEIAAAPETYVLSCLMCNRKFTDLVEYETHRCNRKSISTDCNNVADKERCQDTNEVYLEPDFPSCIKESAQCASSEIDFNFLCIICGVNFENEEKLNLHLYENHQSCDQETVKEGVNSFPLTSDVADSTLACGVCSETFPDDSALQTHRSECRSGTDRVQTLAIDAGLLKNIKQEILSDENSILDVPVCEHCKKEFLNLVEMRAHKNQCTVRNVSGKDPPIEPDAAGLVPELFAASNFCSLVTQNSSDTEQHFGTFVVPGSENVRSDRVATPPDTNHSSEVAIREDAVASLFTCGICAAEFSEESELADHRKDCKDEKSCDVLVRWLCRYCKVSFSTKEEMRSHKELCALEHRSFQRKGVLVKWLCKYCKKDFDSRDCMQNHKKSCSLRNKDRSVVSSTESEMSEVLSKESVPTGNANSSDHDDRKTTIISDDVRTPEKPSTHLETNSDGESNAEQTSGNSKSSSAVIPETTRKKEEVKEEILVHDYNLCEIQNKSDSVSEDRVGGNNEDAESNSLAVSDPEEGFLVKWVCKYCKEVFDDREQMSVHKKACALSVKRRRVFSGTESGGKEPVLNGTSRERENLSSTDVHPDDSLCNAQPAIKLKIKLKHKCNICGKNFPVRKLLRAHKLDSHMIKCKCGRYFSNYSVLWKHARMCRTSKVPTEKRKAGVYSCKKCYRVFREKYKYNLHKGSCQHQKLESDRLGHVSAISLPHEKILLRIQCHKCSGSYVGREIISLHTCEKARDVKAQLCCVVCMESFSSITSFCSHSINCTLDLPGVSEESVPSRILCHSCLRQFTSIFFFYLHLIAGTCGDDFFKDCFHSADINGTGAEPTCISDSPSESSSELSSDDEEMEEWTCSFCSFIFPTSIPKVTHYQMCRKKIASENGNLTKNVAKSRSSKNRNTNIPLRTLKIVLRRLPRDLISKYLKPRLSESEKELSKLNLKQTPVRRCVICFKKCCFFGTGLPPIGQLECFRCREKMHRRELKKRGERFYCRSMFDEDVGPGPVVQIETQTSYSVGYLDPSKRLKVSRALSKAKQTPREQDLPAESSASTSFARAVIRPVGNGMTKLVRKCSHCKRGFANKEQLDKHMKLSKTCLHSEASRLKSGGKKKRRSVEPRSSIINFVDFFSQVPRTFSLDQNGVTVSSDVVSPSPSPDEEINQENSFSNVETDTNSFDEYESSNCSHSETPVTEASVESSAIFLNRPSPRSTRTTFLVLDDVEKALRSRSIMKRIPSSPALQCDGWILESSVHRAHDGSKKIKLICGSCYRSFSDRKTFLQHVSTVHELCESAATKLNVMRHIPKEMLNKISW